jgi:hypothetical protein
VHIRVESDEEIMPDSGIGLTTELEHKRVQRLKLEVEFLFAMIKKIC